MFTLVFPWARATGNDGRPLLLTEAWEKDISSHYFFIEPCVWKTREKLMELRFPGAPRESHSIPIEEAGKVILVQFPEEAWSCWHCDLWHLDSRTVRQYTSAIWSYSVWGTLLTALDNQYICWKLSYTVLCWYLWHRHAGSWPTICLPLPLHHTLCSGLPTTLSTS